MPIKDSSNFTSRTNDQLTYLLHIMISTDTREHTDSLIDKTTEEEKKMTTHIQENHR